MSSYIESIKYNKAKTYGAQTSHLVMGVYELGKEIFNLGEAAKITGLKGQSLLNLVYRLVKKGVLTRLKSGLYQIVPLQMGHTKEYMGDPCVVAREIVRQSFKTMNPKYFISHASAMEIHQMVTQPQFEIFVTASKQIRNRQILGTNFHFVTAKPAQIFGVKKHWVHKTELVMVSDLERTILDGLKMPQYCGGITELAKGFWIKRSEIDLTKLVDYAEKMAVGAVFRRLGYLLEVYEMDCPNEVGRLEQNLTQTYLLLDPILPAEGEYNSRWKLRLNISKEELLATVRT